MVTIKTYIDTRRTGDDEPAPVKIAISQNRKTAYISTGVKCLPSNFNAKKGVIISGPGVALYNSIIQKVILRCQMAVVELTDSGRITTMTAAEIKQYIDNGEQETAPTLFVEFFERHAAGKKNDNTRRPFASVLKHIRDFDKNAGHLTFDRITPQWLRDFDDFLSAQNIRVNSRMMYMSAIRTIINAAINDELTTNYPFRKFRFRHEPTRKRNLPVMTLRFLYSMPIVGHDAYYRDLFFLSLFLVGINASDLYKAEASNDGRLVYRRSKTGRRYDIKIEPEAQRLIDKYKGHNGKLIDVSERCSTVSVFTSLMNRALNNMIPGVTQYWCRHSWATIAAELDIPMDTISAALGHSHGSPVTNIYIDFNQKKIDDANRRVIDYILYNKK